jgi:parallel beta-helix repeat protein
MKQIAILLFSAITFQQSAVAQGPITPLGAPAPTMKTLAQIEPRTPISSLPYLITQPGSYYVTTNLTGPAAQSGITIVASGVTLDLMGFELVGGGGSINGIVVSGSSTNIAVRNGTVRGWSTFGVITGNAVNSQLERLAVSKNGSHGIVAGNGSMIKVCTASFNAGDGFNIGSGSTVSGCSAQSNSFTGIFAGGGGSTIKDCTVSFNTGSGIYAFIGSTVNGCTARSNGITGIVAGDGSTVIGCTANSNIDGIVASSGCTIKDSTVSGNSGIGIVAADGSTVNDCTARSNLAHGIKVSSRCRVTDNNCLSNGTGTWGAGIWATSGENRIDGNNVVNNNNKGILVDAGGNAVTRNTARSNTGGDYTGAGLVGSAVGEVLDFSFGGTITNVSPWANFRN